MIYGEISTKRRTDIQSLRALAVIFVVLFHTGFTASSGFIGVDIFFVISGFVIANLLITEFDATGKVNLINFYLRRTLRLLPALGLMVLVSAILAFFLLSPLGMQQNSAKTGIGALLISANWIIPKVSQGYFDLPAETNIYLHTWSLSVEEQFYLVFPIILIISLMFANKNNKQKLLKFLFLGIGFCSFSLYLFSSHGLFEGTFTWLNGFYSPLTRTWEFSIGVLTLFISRYSKKLEVLLKRPTRLFSLTILIICIFLPANILKYPSFWLPIPLLATSHILYFGAKAGQSPSRFFNSHKLNFVGDRSYAIYLWHWPAIVLAKYLFPQNEVALLLFLLAGISIALFTFYKVESPIRKLNFRKMKVVIAVWIVFALIPLGATGLLGYVSKNISFKKYESGQVQGHYQGDIGAIGFDSFSSEYPSVCTTPKMKGIDPLIGCDADVAIIGDSHAQHLLPGFSRNFPNLKFIGLDSNFLRSMQLGSYRTRLNILNQNNHIKLIILNAYWAVNAVPEDLNQVIKSLVSHQKSVIVLDDVPNFPFDSFTCKYGFSTFIQHSNCKMNAGKFYSQRAHYSPMLKRVVDSNPGSEYIETSKLFCNGHSCSMVKNGVLNYLDLNHLNINGSIYISREVSRNSKFFCNAFRDKVGDICRK